MMCEFWHGCRQFLLFNTYVWFRFGLSVILLNSWCYPEKIYLFKVSNRNSREKGVNVFKVNNKDTRMTSLISFVKYLRTTSLISFVKYLKSHILRIKLQLRIYTAGIYLFKVKNRNIKTIYEIYSKIFIKVVRVSLLLTLNIFHTFF